MRTRNKKTNRVIPLILVGTGLLILGIVSGVWLVGTSFNVQDIKDISVIPAQVNFPVPEINLATVSGDPVYLDQLQGKVVLINNWATWCPPCKAEMPTLQTYHNKYKDEGFTVIAINDGDPTSDVLQFVDDYKLSFPVWLDPTYIATEQAFKTLNLPSSYVIDRSGITRLSWVGEINRKTLEKFVTPIIKEKQ